MAHDFITKEGETMELDLKLAQQVFGDMEKRLRDTGIQVKNAPPGDPSQLGETLCALIPVNQADEMVLLEMMFVKLSEAVGMIRFFTTLAVDIEKGYDALLQADEYMNFFSPVGTFGLVPEEKQFFHKYSILVEAEDGAERHINQVRRAFDVVYATLSSYLPAVLALTEEGKSFQEVLDQGLLTP